MAPQPVSIGLLLIQGTGCLPQQLRHFLESGNPEDPSDRSADPPEAIRFHVLPAAALPAALEQKLISRPALWVDEAEAATGSAVLQIAYFLGSGPHSRPLPVKPITLQPIRKGPSVSAPATYRAFVTAKAHLHLYRVVQSLFPELERWHADLQARGIVAANPTATVGQIRAQVMENGLLLERHSAQSGITSRVMVAINLQLACLELQPTDASGAPLTAASTNYSAKCLRTVHTLEEAFASLQPSAQEQQLASPSASPTKANGIPRLPEFQSPSKAPRHAARLEDLINEGVTLLQSCSSTELREGASLLQAAAAQPSGAAAAAAAGAIEALVLAAASILPSKVMGTTEQLTLLNLTLAALLDADTQGEAASRLIRALEAGLDASACPNPTLFCKLLLALLQRSDVRHEAMQQGLWATLSAAYRQKSPQLEAVAAALMAASPAAAAVNGNDKAASSAERHAASSPSPATPGGSVGGRVGGLPGFKSTPGGKLSIPRLVLHPEEDERARTPTGGLTRATRREMGSTTPEWRAPSGWASPRTLRAAKEASAASEMEALAEALGEGLMALDLVSVVAHKRRADLLKDSESDTSGSIPADLLDGPPLNARQQVLQAHRIFTTAKSMRSLDSTPARSAATVSVGGGSERSAEVSSSLPPTPPMPPPADVAEIKGLLLQAMAAALPLPGQRSFNSATAAAAAATAQDPAPILAAEVLSIQAKGASPAQEALRGSCLQLLSRLALREAAAGSRRPGGAHVFLIATGAKLGQVLAGGSKLTDAASAEAVDLMHSAAEYLSQVEAPSAAAAVAQHCLGPVSLALAALQAGSAKPVGWSVSAWALMHSVFVLLAPALGMCSEPEAGRALIAVILGDYKAAGMLVAVADLALFRGGKPPAAYLGRWPALQRDLLGFFTALAGLLARQPAASGLIGSPSADGTSSAGLDVLLLAVIAGKEQRRRLTRRHALNFFSFIVAPGNEFLRRVLDCPALATGGAAPKPVPPAAGAMRLRPALFDLLKTLFAAPGSPFAEEKAVSDYYVRFHFIQFLKLYHNPTRDHQAPFLCRQHMGVLLALAGSAAPHVRTRFQQLSVVDFFVRELSLEFEASQPGGGGGGGGGRLSDASSSPDLQGLVGINRTVSAGVLGRKGSPAGGSGTARDGAQLLSPKDAPQPAGSHKRGSSQSGVPLLPLKTDSVVASPPVPKLRLPGSGRRSADSSRQQSPAGNADKQDSSRRLSFGVGGSSRRASPHPTSRLGRDAAAQAAAAAADSAKRPMVPKLGLVGLGLSRSHSEALTPTTQASDSDYEDDDRISSTVQEVRRSSHSSDAGSSRPLDRSTSAAISLDKGWNSNSARSAFEQADSGSAGGSVSRRHRGSMGSSEVMLPSGFVFSGDLDEDVEMLEALERENDDGSDDGSSDGSEEVAQAPPPRLKVPGLQLALGIARRSSSGTGGGDTSAAAAERSPVPLLAMPPKQPATDSLPDSPPQRATAQPVPRLTITSSMHSTLEARMASAELQVALEAERSRRQAGRSFFGDLERSALGKGKMQAARLGRRASRSSVDGIMAPLMAGSSAGEVSYADERFRRLVYRDVDLHLQVLVLVFTLILDPHGQLDPRYCDQYPWDRKLQNIPFVLHHHLNHPDNRALLPRLLPALHALGPPALRLLRTLCSTFFRPGWYGSRARISGVAGAYATVYRCSLPAWSGGATAVLKLLDTPRHIQDRCTQVDFHSEVTILDTLAGRACACQMHDFGLDPRSDALLLVLEDYRCSLKQWRAAQPVNPAAQLRLYYSVFREVVVAVGRLLDSGVIHFDLKCDNVLLEPVPGASAAEFWSASTPRPAFRVVLADFGESKMVGSEGRGPSAAAAAAAAAAGPADGHTTRARGTDAFKSPEMLLVGGAVQKGHRGYDRRRGQGAGAPSDVWSLGCLLFELVTGKLLFSDSDWLQLVARVTSANMQLITDDRAATVAPLPGILDLLQYMLVRDPALRPTLRDTLDKVDAVMAAKATELPQHLPSGATPHADLQQQQQQQQQLSFGSGLERSMHGMQPPHDEPPLPLVAPLPLSPGRLLLGPAAGVRRRDLQEWHISRVVVVSSAAEAGTAALEVPPVLLLRDSELVGLLDACLGAGVPCDVLCCPREQGAASTLAAWVESALPRVAQGGEGRRGAVLLVAQGGREGDAALLAVAHAVREEGCSRHRAMVRAAQWGVDLHLTGRHLEALRLMK